MIRILHLYQRWCWSCMLGLAVAVGLSSPSFADDFDLEPINYRVAEPNNVVSRWVQRLKSGEAKISTESDVTAIRDVLNALNIPLASQVLVFSKTSLQRDRISPRTPRAIYFNDDVYLGFCQGSRLLELSVVDPQLGTVFYSLDRADADQPIVERQIDNCLLCHASSHTRQVPGSMVRSVFADGQGMPLLSMGSQRVDHSTPFEKRWGGWYVSGTHGKLSHLGNLILSKATEPEAVDKSGGNVVDLSSYFDTNYYPSPHSDLIALMVLEHQAEGHNLITRAGFQCRMALHQQMELNRELKKPLEEEWQSTQSRIHGACEDLLKYLLFCEEAPLAQPVKGVSGFAEEFAGRGPRDSQGRSLRDLQLQGRLFRYPCSYLIYSEAFQALPERARDQIWKRLKEVLTGTDTTRVFEHLSANDRREIREILIATHQHLPAGWGK